MKNKEKSESEKIKGGFSSGMDLEDVVKKHSKFLEKKGFKTMTEKTDRMETELKKGIKVEKEHTKDPAMAKEIALDHLSEFPFYYTGLSKLEKDLEQDYKKTILKEGEQQTFLSSLKKILGIELKPKR